MAFWRWCQKLSRLFSCSFLLLFLPLPNAANEQSEQSAAQINDRSTKKMQVGDYRDGYRLALKAKSVSKTNGNKAQLSRALSNQASCLFYLGDNQAALSLYNEAILISKSIADHQGTFRTLNNIAAIYLQMGNLTETLRYREEQHLLVQRHGDKHQLLSVLISLGQTNIELSHLAEAKEYILLARKIIERIPNPFLEIYLSFAEAEIAIIENNFEIAKQVFNRSLKIANENEYKGLIATIHIDMANLYYVMNNLRLAELETKKSIELAKILELSAIQLQGHWLLVNILSDQERFKEALKHTKIANTIKSGISGEKVKLLGEITKIDRQILETEEKLKNSQQQEQILSLKLERQKYNQIIWIISFGIIFMVAFFLYYRITSKKEIVRQKVANQHLRELDRIKDRILKNTSHELRTPLNGIIGLSDIVLQEADNKLDKGTIDLVKLIRSSGEQLSLVINDILELSKLKSEKVRIRNVLFNLDELIRDVILVCTPLATDKNLEIEYHPQKTQQSVIQDKTRLQQILFNIIGNAVKFTEKGYVSVVVALSETLLQITISDSGIGVPEDKLERIFEGFEQIDNGDSRSNQGSGLGLAISRNLAVVLGGSLLLTSELGCGTMVKLSLPLKTLEKDS